MIEYQLFWLIFSTYFTNIYIYVCVVVNINILILLPFFLPTRQ